MSRSLWMGDLEPYMDETFIQYVFQAVSSQVVSVKAIKRRDTGQPAGYCFIEFRTEEEAERILKTVNGKEIPGTTPTRRFRLNRAQGGKNWDNGPSFSIFVGDLDTTITDDKLEDFFLQKYRSVKGGKVMFDEHGESRGYGFVRFSDEAEQKKALIEMQGACGLGSRPIKVSHATPKNKPPSSTTTPTSPTDQTSYSATQQQQQWWQQYQDYQYYQQYYNYYNYQQPNYYNQQATYGNTQQSQYGTQPNNTTANTMQARKLSEKLEDPDRPLDIQAENEIFMREHSGFIDDVVNCHWQPLDTITSKIPELPA